MCGCSRSACWTQARRWPVGSGSATPTHEVGCGLCVRAGQEGEACTSWRQPPVGQGADAPVALAQKRDCLVRGQEWRGLAARFESLQLLPVLDARTRRQQQQPRGAEETNLAALQREHQPFVQNRQHLERRELPSGGSGRRRRSDRHGRFRFCAAHFSAQQRWNSRTGTQPARGRR